MKTGTIIITACGLLIGFILKEEFYNRLCELGKLTCSLGGIAFKSPIGIIIIIGLAIFYGYKK